MFLRAEEKVAEALFENGLEMPDWLKVKNSKTVLVKVDSWQAGEHKVTVEDVVKYFAFESCNLFSGIRRLGGIIGDWRQIDNLANLCHEIFKITSIRELRRTARKYGLKPKY